MREQRVIQILQALIHGTDPFTGEELSQDTVLQNAEVVRAILTGYEAIVRHAARAQRRSHLPGNVGKPWSAEEEVLLIESFNLGRTTAELAEQHGRTVRAIESRLEKLELLAPGERSTQDRFAARPPDPG